MSKNLTLLRDLEISPNRSLQLCVTENKEAVFLSRVLIHLSHELEMCPRSCRDENEDINSFTHEPLWVS